MLIVSTPSTDRQTDTYTHTHTHTHRAEMDLCYVCYTMKNKLRSQLAPDNIELHEI